MSHSGLTVRHHERKTIDLAAEFAITEAHQGQVRFSASSVAQDRHAIAVRCVDMSPGGVGMKSEIYLPRMVEGVLRVFDPNPTGTGMDGAPARQVVLEHRVKIRRVFMTSETPEYFLGTSFMEADPWLQERIEELVRRLNAADGGSEGGVHA